MIRRWIISADAAPVAARLGIFALGFALAGLLLAMALRVQLGWPESGLVRDDESYNALVTLHGSLMVFFVVVPGLLGCCSLLSVSGMTSRSRLSLARSSSLGGWLVVAGGCLLLATFALPSGPASSSWMALPPLSIDASYSQGSGPGQAAWLVGMALGAFGMLLLNSSSFASLMQPTTPHSRRSTQIAFSGSSLLGCMAQVVFAVLWLSLLFERSTFDESILTFIPRLYPAFSASALDLLAWSFLLAAWGTVVMAFRPVSDDPALDRLASRVSAWLFGLGMLRAIARAIAHAQPEFAETVLVLASVSAAAPLYWCGLFGLRSLRQSIAGTARRDTARRDTERRDTARPEVIYALGLTLVVGISLLAGALLDSGSGASLLRGTYFELGHIHMIYGATGIFALFTALAYHFPRLSGRRLSTPLTWLHLWLTLPPFVVFTIVLEVQGLRGGVRHAYLDVGPSWLSILATCCAIIATAAQMLFVANCIWSSVSGDRVDAESSS